MTSPEGDPVSVGEVLWLDLWDHCPGVGPLTLRVTGVGERQELHGASWLNLRGVPLLPDGSEDQERYALVRVAALRSFRAGRGGPSPGG